MPSTTSKTKLKHSWSFDAIGTKWSIETNQPLLDTLKRAIENRIELFDIAYSRFRDDSTVAAMAKAPDEFTLPNDAKQLGDLYRQLYEATDGALSPLIGSSLNAAGYDKKYSFRTGDPLKAVDWDSVMTWSGVTITTNKPIALDVGAAGKGLLVDEVSELIERSGITEYVVDASGDVCSRGDSQRIGLENPLDPTMVIGTIDIRNESICASATNRRQWGNGWHHVLDARTGMPVSGVLATWVVAESTMFADGLATALFFVPANKLTTVAPFEYVRMMADGTVEYSERFVGQLYL